MHRAGTSVVARGLAGARRRPGRSPDVRRRADERARVLRGRRRRRASTTRCSPRSPPTGRASRCSTAWTGAARAAGRPARRRAPRAGRAHRARAGRTASRTRACRACCRSGSACSRTCALADAYVIAVRHPRAVIDSLTARDGLDVRRSGWLWLGHLVCALRYTQDRPRVVVDYDRLLAAPERELARMARALGLPAPGADALRDYAHGFLARDLRHAEYAPDDLDPAAVPPLVADAHALAQRLATPTMPMPMPTPTRGPRSTGCSIASARSRRCSTTRAPSSASPTRRRGSQGSSRGRAKAWRRRSPSTRTCRPPSARRTRRCASRRPTATTSRPRWRARNGNSSPRTKRSRGSRSARWAACCSSASDADGVIPGARGGNFAAKGVS